MDPDRWNSILQVRGSLLSIHHASIFASSWPAPDHGGYSYHVSQHKLFFLFVMIVGSFAFIMPASLHPAGLLLITEDTLIMFYDINSSSSLK